MRNSSRYFSPERLELLDEIWPWVENPQTAVKILNLLPGPRLNLALVSMFAETRGLFLYKKKPRVIFTPNQVRILIEGWESLTSWQEIRDQMHAVDPTGAWFSRMSIHKAAVRRGLCRPIGVGWAKIGREYAEKKKLVLTTKTL